MPDFELAEINVACLVAPLTDPQIADFVADLKPINALAEQSAGFLWRLQTAEGDATSIPYSADPLVIVNMSVWTSPETLRDFVYRSRHVEVYRKRAHWFEPHDQAPYCLWWVPTGHRPTVDEGHERLAAYHRNGATEESFWFNRLFPAPTLVLA